MQRPRSERNTTLGWLALAAGVVALSAWYSNTGPPPGPSATDAGRLHVRRASLQAPPAPSFDGAVGWINSGPIDLASLKGKVVLLDFWTYCCINCHHILPDLEKLEKKYKNELVVIGVHSGKFDAERNTENIRRKVAEYRIKHPVVNDAEMIIWERFDVHSWPTRVLIDPDGQVVVFGRDEDGNPITSIGGEGRYELFDFAIGKLADTFRKAGKLDETPMTFATEESQYADKPLLFPGKVLADAKSNRLFISDTGHDRIVQTDLDGKNPVLIGGGGQGLVDGDFATARFNRQQGMCLEGDVLYVADTENHAIRTVDLKAKTVTTVVGDGKQSDRDPRPPFEGPGKTSTISSPWDVIQVPGSRTIYIAMAGTHQIYAFDPESGVVRWFAGSGYENILDGTPAKSRFAQPSGFATDGENLFIADSEVSGVRVISGLRDAAPKVGRVVGMGLFEFGDRDGVGPAQVRLQHCLGLAFGDGKLYIADTYNNKVKVCDPEKAAVETFLGAVEAGDSDDPPRFHEPGGLSFADGKLYVADTNNHKIRVVDLGTRAVKTLEIPDLKPPGPPSP
ncbi:thioredoxin-like domain-containing protein [Planctomyces sp. SH-PL62]|uniref:thioredoxin-like domain-containing protein n=1 Tax=Planctomyces sp. SH-PL62 TaxID=1636152 RepID=UPI00078C1B09|nr:thioredoxin-like domain-containing protein [Planctomyces sp. SH-PL62]AMV36974.1 Thiol-disulfide oxidoreductase ResA [Planctomyces sp. SH-PL62]